MSQKKYIFAIKMLHYQKFEQNEILILFYTITAENLNYQIVFYYYR